ncbi:MAG: PDR/VanB family oxidoreductase [Micromonosporaceae bacterium]
MHSTHDEVELDLLLERKCAAADGVVVLALSCPGGDPLPAWEPGAHIDFHLGPDLVRQYSLCGDPADATRWHVAVLREPAGRGGSRYVHDELAEGSTIHVRGPRNHFVLLPAKRYLFIAGGIGITPIIPMIAAAEAAAAEWRLVYGGRSRSSMAFRSSVVSAYGAKVDLRPQDETGLLDLDTLLSEPWDDALVYCCGPEPLLTAVEQRCAGWAPGSLRVERFAPKAMAEPVRHDTFEVALARSGATVLVPPGRSILECVEAIGVYVVSSCQEGTCGTCETTVLNGVVDHRDSVLTPEEQEANDTMMICCSRSVTSRLVLDL